MGKIETRLSEMGLTLPTAAAPAANYVPFVRSGTQLILSGQLPFKDGKLIHLGHLGDELTIDEGYRAARLCGINLIAQMKAALGDLDRVVRVLRLGGFVASVPTFADQPKVINGASDLMVEVFGDAGRHARSAVGVPALPLGVAVEIDAIVEVA